MNSNEVTERRKSRSSVAKIDGQVSDTSRPPVQTNPIPSQPKKQQTPSKENPAPFGLACYALTVIIFEFYDFGWVSKAPTVCIGVFVGGIGLFTAGLLEFASNDTFCTTAFTVFGVYRISFVAILLLPDVAGYSVNDADSGFFRLSLFFFSSAVLIAAYHRALSVFMVFLALTLGTGIISAGAFTAQHAVKIVGSVFVLISGFGAFYNMTAVLLENAFGYKVLPMGSPLAEIISNFRQRMRGSGQNVT